MRYKGYTKGLSSLYDRCISWSGDLHSRGRVCVLEHSSRIVFVSEDIRHHQNAAVSFGHVGVLGVLECLTLHQHPFFCDFFVRYVFC